LRKLIPAIFCFGLTVVVPGFADTVIAIGAGPLPSSAQDLSSDLALTEITGSLDFPLGVSMFKIDILFPSDFSAQTVPAGALGVPDPELFLFDSSGLGVYQNDDESFSDLQACLPSADSGNPCPSSRNGAGPLTAGIYYLAITRSANSSMSSSGYIFSPVLSTDVVGPDLTMGGGDPISSWDGNVFTSPNFDQINYDILITDSPIATPEPVTWPLLSAAVTALVLFRQKLRRR